LVQLYADLEKDRLSLEQQVLQTAKEYHKVLELHRLVLSKKMDKDNDLMRMDNLLETARKMREEVTNKEVQYSTHENVMVTRLSMLSNHMVENQYHSAEELRVVGNRMSDAISELVITCQNLQLHNCRDGRQDYAAEVDGLECHGAELKITLAKMLEETAQLTVAKNNASKYSDISLTTKEFIMWAVKEERKEARSTLMKVHMRRRFLEKRPLRRI